MTATWQRMAAQVESRPAPPGRPGAVWRARLGLVASYATQPVTVRVLVILLVSLLVLGMLVVAGYGVDSSRMIATFGADEELAVRHALRNLHDGDLNPRGFYFYGAVYANVSMLSVFALRLLGFAASDRLVAVVLRLWSVASFGLLLYGVARLARRFWPDDRRFRDLAVLVTAALPSMVRWAIMIHPDVLQAALLVLACVACFEAQDEVGARRSAWLCGVAFGTKYGGIFLYPFAMIPAAVARVRGRAESSGSGSGSGSGSVGVGLRAMVVEALRLGWRQAPFFLLGWLLTNPYVIGNPASFVRSLRQQSSLAARGWQQAEGASPLLWWPHVLELTGPVSLYVLAVGLTLLAALGWRTWHAWRRRGPGWVSRLSPRAVTLGTVAGYVACLSLYLAAFVRMRLAHYLLPVAPFMVLLALWGLWRALPPARRHTLVAALGAVGIVGWVSAMSVVAEASHKYERLDTTVSDWLREHYPPSTPIVADYYVYVEPRFANVCATWGDYDETMQRCRPRVLVVTQGILGRFVWKEPATTLSDRRWTVGTVDGASRVRAEMERLLGGDSPWRVVYETESAVILEDPSWAATP